MGGTSGVLGADGSSRIQEDLRIELWTYFAQFPLQLWM